ncbi:MAG: hypothetical protein ACR2IM_05350, partial [Sediminibacterium sp.]
MKKLTLILSLFFVLIGNVLFGQAKAEWTTIFNKINAEVLDHSKAYSSLKNASETIGHRLTGSENGKRAEEYAYNLLKSYGFTEVKYQPFEVESWSRGTISVSIGNDINTLQSIKSVSLAYAPVNVNQTLELVDMGNGLEEDYLSNPKKVAGKVALVYLGVLPGSK